MHPYGLNTISRHSTGPMAGPPSYLAGTMLGHMATLRRQPVHQPIDDNLPKTMARPSMSGVPQYYYGWHPTTGAPVSMPMTLVSSNNFYPPLSSSTSSSSSMTFAASTTPCITSNIGAPGFGGVNVIHGGGVPSSASSNASSSCISSSANQRSYCF